MSASHRVAVIRQVVNALRKTFDSDYPDSMFQAVYIGPNFQLTQEKYPAIFVAYQERSIQDIGLGHYVEGTDEQGMDRRFRQALAQGAIQFTVMAQTPLERDTLLDDLMDVIMFGKEDVNKSAFWREIFDDDWIWLELNTKNIIPGGVSSLAAPWQSENDLLFTGSYTLNSIAEFFSDMDTSDLVPINHIKVYPYRDDQAVPTGNDTGTPPSPWNP